MPPSPISGSIPSNPRPRESAATQSSRPASELDGDAVCLVPFRHSPARYFRTSTTQSRGDERACASDVGERRASMSRKAVCVIPRGEVLAADVPVHPKIAAQLQTALEAAPLPDRAAARSVSSASWMFPSSRIPRFDRRRLDRCPRFRRGSPERSRRTGARASARFRRSRLRRRAARGRTRGSSADAAAGCRRRRPARVPCRRATRARRGCPRRGRRRPPRRPRTCTLPEDRHAPEHALFRLLEQRVAPVDRGAQGLLPLVRVALARGQDVERAVEPLEEPFRRQQP